MNNISLSLNDVQIALLSKTYSEYRSNSSNQYIEAVFKVKNCTITVYKTKKVLFQGKDAEIYASAFMSNDVDNAGSDEVGTGDFFGPVVVVASIIDKKTYQEIRKLKIDDSKKIDDDYIRKIGPLLIEKVKHSLLVLDNMTYNQIQPENNMNAIKAKMHNQAYLNLIKKYGASPVYILDQFCSKENYFRYLKDTPEVIANIHFETKAESKYLSVATSSIIARYVFLLKMDELRKKYGIDFHQGAAKQVNDDGIEFVKRYGIAKINEVAKLNFKNYERIVNSLCKEQKP
jgi:ribonuclease HIII